MVGRQIAAMAYMASWALAAPAPAPAPTAVANLEDRALLGILDLNSVISLIAATPASAQAPAYTSLYKAIVPSAAPTNTASAMSALASVYNAYPSNPLAAAAGVLAAGLAGSTNPLGNISADAVAFGPCNGVNFTNPAPPTPVYPQKAAGDAPYDQTETALRGDIYFPPGYTYGKIKPAIFIPGTGVEACEAFANNLGKLFTGSSYADPVYVNVPGNLLMDVQTNAEYVAYAINYISAVSKNSNVTVVSWSQGGPATQWAFKYWPSTRKVTSDHIAVSPDYHGTVLEALICPTGASCAPALLQQAYNSNFINTLRANGGSSAYVPTTEIHSVFDEIVEPQQDPFASADLSSGNGVAATNVQIESVCLPVTLAGTLKIGHEGSLYNPVTFAVAVDAITNPGSANIARSGAANVCGTYFTNGLTLTDVLATEAMTLLAAYNTEAYPNKVTTEPPIKAYAA